MFFQDSQNNSELVNKQLFFEHLYHFYINLSEILSPEFLFLKQKYFLIPKSSVAGYIIWVPTSLPQYQLYYNHLILQL